MGGNTIRLIDGLEVQGNNLNSFPEFKKLFINQYALLDNKNIARDKFHKLQKMWPQCKKYNTAFDNVVVALPELAKEDAIHAFVYGLNPCLKGSVKSLVERPLLPGFYLIIVYKVTLLASMILAYLHSSTT